ncbi:hypothetical protein NDU88_000683 [Pleurodeles waltl]|uniref:Uncharacterized protein n=1 Tax=Pleurodeles waltl TaxID=8319 RepID=A0AAV7R4V7_PLEWA|nr:hypothetical protein NDU88_000683 [Pleurodeles waltl]
MLSILEQVTAGGTNHNGSRDPTEERRRGSKAGQHQDENLGERSTGPKSQCGHQIECMDEEERKERTAKFDDRGLESRMTLPPTAESRRGGQPTKREACMTESSQLLPTALASGKYNFTRRGVKAEDHSRVFGSAETPEHTRPRACTRALHSVVL